jgi:maleylacetate reductase
VLIEGAAISPDSIRALCAASNNDKTKVHLIHYQSEFVSMATGARVRFGGNARDAVAEELERLGAGRALFLSTPGRSDTCQEFSDASGPLSAGTYARAQMHTPVHVTEHAVKHAQKVDADCLVAIGGGSTTGLGKAIAYRTDLPQLVVPTTYAGSECTPILGQTEHGKKTTLRDSKVLPEVIIYDPALIVSLPAATTVASALNAMAHAVEALYARDRNPVSTMLAIEGLSTFADALPAVIESPQDLDARGKTLYGAWLCGTVLGQVGMALHHKLCHTLGGTFGLPHAETHAIVLAYAIAYNERDVAELLAPVRTLFGSPTAAAGLFQFARQIGGPRALRELGLDESVLDEAADLATQNPYWNPRPVERSEIRQLLQSAWAGEPPHGF